ncbi:MAG: serine/threonine-protein kinase [Steroidobacteraceae bacterium]
MTPESWQHVKAALDEAMSLDSTVRAAYLERLGASDPALRAEVESLLAAEERADSQFLNVPAAADLEAAPAKNRMAGQRLGPYRLLEEIGSGGMGEVYRAVRADDEYQQQVAIKLVRAGVDAAFVGKRLRAERQILATFEHPHIARLLDGGTTPEGVPYLVMELIEGQPITSYCEQCRLDTTGRLKLFLLVCSAVRYAHQHMVIHRDLKPSNILVTAEGSPKLLDFGIAKILEQGAIPARAGVTINGFRILTPKYASPEQLDGATVSAASDVYSLGVILYELLTGFMPFRCDDRTASDVVKEIFDLEPRRPSTIVMRRAAPAGPDAAGPPREATRDRLRRRLRGDLDNIVLKALRKDPSERYGTVEGLAEDIRRHLEHLPITARRPTLRYSVSTFIARHRIGVAATAMIVLALAGGIAASTHEALIAEAQRARAVRHLNDVRMLANTLIFEIHDSIRDLPGAAGSRRLLLDTALQYLDRLSRDAQHDPVLQTQLATAYERLGDIRGLPPDVTEQDYAQASQSYRRAVALREARLAAQPDDVETRLAVASDYRALSRILLWQLNDARGALASAERAIAHSRRLAAARPADRPAQLDLAQSELTDGYDLFMVRGDTSSAMGLLDSSIARLRSLLPVRPDEERIARTLALAHIRAGEVLTYRRDYPAALSMSLSARSLLLPLLASQPSNTELRQLEGRSEHGAAAAFVGLGEYDHAMPYEQAALSTFRALSADPHVTDLHADFSMALIGLAQISARRGQPDEAIALLYQALQQAAGGSPAEWQNGYFRHAVARAQAHLGEIYATRARDARRERLQRLADWKSAREWYARALATYGVTRTAWFEAAEESQRIAGEIEQCDRALRTQLALVTPDRGAGET